ncbi:MAG TPA: metallophosphoesterase [Bryobacteraceae bacterium]|nr:metallophosphoesterase [Bryobacteraceae bacterium]
MLHTHSIPSHLTRHDAVGKQRRPYGDPVAALKDMTRFKPVPRPAPGHFSAPLHVFDPKAARAAQDAGKLVFHCVGDTGGIHGTATQEAIATEMENQIQTAGASDKARFLYHLGDVIYFNGQSTLYKTEFYEPYQYYPALIFAIPGNHDGDTQVNRGDLPDTEPSLYGFFQNFCDATPQHVSPYRMSMTQPYPYWTLDAPFVTIVGLYSNVEGALDARGRNDQQQYLETAMKNAAPDKKLLLTMHHPPFSLDSVHGGAIEILTSVDRAISSTGRKPDAVLSGHVHNYQRFSRTLDGKTIPYVVAGAGGYANDARNMHRLQKGIEQEKLPYQTTLKDVQLQNFQQTEPGFLRITASAAGIAFEYWIVPFNGSPAALFDRFSV